MQGAVVRLLDDLLAETQNLARATGKLATIDGRCGKLARLVDKAHVALLAGNLVAFENTSAAAVDENRRLKLEICN